jgi:hypothetical protein
MVYLSLLERFFPDNLVGRRGAERALSPAAMFCEEDVSMETSLGSGLQEKLK